MGKIKRKWRQSNNEGINNAIDKRRADEKSRGAEHLKSDEQLFYIDKSGNDQQKKKDNIQLNNNNNKVVKKKKLNNNNNNNNNNNIKESVLLAKKKLKRNRLRRKKRKQNEMNNNNNNQQNEGESLQVETVHNLDIWNDDNNNNNKTLSKSKRRVVIRSKAATVDLPLTATMDHAGTSVNPTEYDHQNLLKKAYEIDEKERKAKEDVDLYLQGKHPSLKVNTIEPWTDEQVDANIELPIKRVIRAENRITKTQRNKQKRVILMEKDHQNKRKSKELRHQLRQINDIIKDINKEEEEQLNKQLNKRTIEREVRLSKHKLKEQFPTVALSQDISGSMLNIPITGSIVSDQFQRFHKRRFIEPRIKQTGKRKRKYKLVTKKAFKGIK